MPDEERLYLRVGCEPLTWPTHAVEHAAFHAAAAPPALRAHVAMLRWGREWIPPDRPVRERIVPDGSAHLIVDFTRGDDVRALVVGPGRGPSVIELAGAVEQMGAELRPGAIPALFGVPAGAVAGREVPLDTLWGAARARDLTERLAAAHDAATRVRVLQDALTSAAGKPAPPPVGEALQHLARTRGALRIEALAQRLGVTSRRLQQLFDTHVGLSPKEAARLARFHAAVDALAARTVRSWVDLAAGSGFADQSHLVQEFQAWAGLAPTTFLARSGFAFLQD